MSIFDQIKADREVGTKGDFAKVTDHEWGLDTEGENAYYVIGPNNRPLAVVAVEQAFGMDHINAADMRRFCRLPQLERIALAAEELAAAVEDDTGSFEDAQRIARAHMAFLEAFK